jgi:DNA-binding transcriptional LysR family regulator
VTLIDRTRRPVALTWAGEVFADHARTILASIDAAQSAVGAVRGATAGEVTVLTTPGIGAIFLPQVLAEFARRYPRVRVELVERSRPDLDHEHLPPGALLGLLPVRPGGTGPQLKQRPLWRERMRVVVPAGHDLALLGGPVPVAALLRQPLLLLGPSHEAAADAALLSRHTGLHAHLAATADTPATIVSLVRAGIGVGLLHDVALRSCATDGTVVLDLDDPAMTRTVAAVWHDVLLDTDLGRALHKAVVSAPPPEGLAPVPAARS